MSPHDAADLTALTSKLWPGDIDQTEYAARNLTAVKRGAIIRRLFIILPAMSRPSPEPMRGSCCLGVNRLERGRFGRREREEAEE